MSGEGVCDELPPKRTYCPKFLNIELENGTLSIDKHLLRPWSPLCMIILFSSKDLRLKSPGSVCRSLWLVCPTNISASQFSHLGGNSSSSSSVKFISILVSSFCHDGSGIIDFGRSRSSMFSSSERSSQDLLDNNAGLWEFWLKYPGTSIPNGDKLLNEDIFGHNTVSTESFL